MKKLFRKILFFIMVSFLVIITGILVAGKLMPEQHVASRWVELGAPPSEVWIKITDFSNTASWRPDVEKVVAGLDAYGREIWVEFDSSGKGIPYATVEQSPPLKLVREIADPDLPFGGSWTFELQPTEHGTRLTITENGFVPSPFVRFISAVFIGHTTFMENYLIALGRAYGEQVEPRPAS